MVTWTVQPPGGGVYTTDAAEEAATITLPELDQMRALRADLSAGDGAERIATTQAGAGAVSRPLAQVVRDLGVSVVDFGAVGDGSTDDSDAFDRAVASGARRIFVPPYAGGFKTTRKISLNAEQMIVGVPRPLVSADAASGSFIKFRPSGAAICIANVDGKYGCGVLDLGIDMADAASFGVAWTNSYGNKANNLVCTGTFDVGIYLDQSYVCEISNPVFNGARIKHYAIYLGRQNQTQIRGVHTGSSYPADNSVASVGLGIKDGKGVSIEEFTAQGPTIGIDIFTPSSVTVRNFYSEVCLCPVRIGDTSGSGNAGTVTFVGGIFSAPGSGHPQYSSRGPIFYNRGSLRVVLLNPYFTNRHADDTNIWNIVNLLKAQYMSVIGGRFQNSDLRTEVYRGTSSDNTSIWAPNVPYGTHSGTEDIRKAAGAFNSEHFGLRIDNSGTITTSSWIPSVIGSAVPSLLTGDFYEPTPP